MELVRVQDSDYRKTYELYMSFPENENGYMNNVYGYNYDQFLEWIEKKRNWSNYSRRVWLKMINIFWNSRRTPGSQRVIII